MAATRRITALEAIPAESTFLFRVTDDEGAEREAILVRDGTDAPAEDGVSCWLNYCQHLTHVRLDKGSGAPMRDGEVVCENHGAYFDGDSGRCTFGPCEGAYLTALEVTVADGVVTLADDDYEFAGTGPIERDPADRTSTSNVEF